MSAALPEDLCPRCGGTFHCGMNDATPCACTGLTLDAALLRRLRERFSACLCLRCLQTLAAGAPLVACEALPGTRRPR